MTEEEYCSLSLDDLLVCKCHPDGFSDNEKHIDCITMLNWDYVVSWLNTFDGRDIVMSNQGYAIGDVSAAIGWILGMRSLQPWNAVVTEVYNRRHVEVVE